MAGPTGYLSVKKSVGAVKNPVFKLLHRTERYT